MGNKHTCPHKIKESVSHQQAFKNVKWNADTKTEVSVKETKLPLKAKMAYKTPPSCKNEAQIEYVYIVNLTFEKL